MDEVEKKIYDIVLAAQTEGIVGGKTKWLAKGDTDDIRDIPLTDGVCPDCKGKGTKQKRIERFRGEEYWRDAPCEACNGTGKKSKTIRKVIEEYYADS